MNKSRNILIKKLALGTVQFGLDYGISNSIGKITQSSINEILKFSQDVGIKYIDTAASYGDSELAIGNSSVQSQEFKIISKCPSDCKIDKQICESVSNSLRNLQKEFLY